MGSASWFNRQTVGLNVRLVRMFKWIRERISDSDGRGWLAETLPARDYLRSCHCDVGFYAIGFD